MASLSVTSRGQVTLRKDVLNHLGIKPGEKIEIDLLPDGKGLLKAARPSGSIDDFIGFLEAKTKKVLTIDEIKSMTEKAWSGKK